MLEIFDRLRAEYPTMSAAALVLAGLAIGWGAGWIFFRQQLATYTAKLEHLQEVLDSKLPASTYRPIRFRKERPVLAGIALIAGGLVLLVIGLGFIVTNFRAVSPSQTTSDALKQSKEDGSDDGPLVWFVNLTMEGGPLQGRNVFSLQFRGLNKSANEVQLKAANIVSGIDGTSLPLEIVADNEVVPLSSVGLIPAGAPITLVAKFGPPDPAAAGKILGLDAKAFLDRWRQFSFNIEDDRRKYRIPFNEASVAPFFPNLVGPRVTRKNAN
jgi:hypothetical protein